MASSNDSLNDRPLRLFLGLTPPRKLDAEADLIMPPFPTELERRRTSRGDGSEESQLRGESIDLLDPANRLSDSEGRNGENTGVKKPGGIAKN